MPKHCQVPVGTPPLVRRTVLVIAPMLLAAGCAPLFPGADVGAAPTAPPPVSSPATDAPPAPTQAAPLSTPWPEGDVARLLADPPAAGEGVELDVYTSYDLAGSLWGGDSKVSWSSRDRCVLGEEHLLTDRHFPSSVSFGDLQRTSNDLPASAAWLVAAMPRNLVNPPPWPPLPYHTRLRGHLGDAGYASCPNADRIFVVDEVLQDYGDDRPEWSEPVDLPSKARNWPRFTSKRLGFSFAYPPNWQVSERSDQDFHIILPDRPDVTLAFKVRDGQTRELDFADPWLAASPDSMVSVGRSRRLQADPAPHDPAGPAPLLWSFATCSGVETACIREVVEFDGHSYQFAIDFPLGFDVPQDELWLFTAIVDSFRVPNQPTKTPAAPETSTPAVPGYP